MRVILIIIAVASLIGACQPESELTEKEKAEIDHEVRSALIHYYDDIRAQGLMAEFNYLHPSDDFFWVPPGSNSPLSYDSIRGLITRNARLFQRVDNSWDTLRITAVNKRLAIYSGRLRSTTTDTSGLVSTFTLVETGVIVKVDERWKLLSGQTALVH